MKFTTKVIGALVLPLLLTGCSDECLYEAPDLSVQATIDTWVPIEIALENADILMAQFETGTRSSERKVESINVIGQTNRTRGLSADSILYVVNYADNAGYAILGTDSRQHSVYAISPTGHLNLSDTVNDSMLSHVINNIIDNAAYSIAPPPTDTGGGGIIIGGSLTYQSYANRRTESVDIPKVLENLTVGDSDDMLNGTLDCTPIALALLKILSTVVEDNCSILTNYYQSLTSESKTTNSSWYSITELKRIIMEAVSDSYLFTSGNYSSIPLNGTACYVFGNHNNHSITGCGCQSYWGMRCNVHTNQMLNLLTGNSGDIPQIFLPQGFMVIGSDTISKSTNVFVVSKLLTQDVSTYSKLTDRLISGPVKEYWLYCLWSETADANGYYRYDKVADELNVTYSKKPKLLERLYLFGGLRQDHTSGL